MSDEVVEETERWLRKAEADLRAAEKLLKYGEEAWIIAFHAQQALEKYLKAYLVYHQKRFRKTHNILDLLDLCIEIDKGFAELEKYDLERFIAYAVEYRYPTPSEASYEEALEAVKTAKEIKEFILSKLRI